MTKERSAYLRELSEDYGVDLDVVFTLACMLGESEDQDGLITTLEDYADSLNEHGWIMI